MSEQPHTEIVEIECCPGIWVPYPTPGNVTQCEGCGSRFSVDAASDPVAAINTLGGIWSPDFDAYASGKLDASQVRCILCLKAPCECPEFGTPEYFALLDARHGRT